MRIDDFYTTENSSAENLKLAICVILTPVVFFCMWWFIG